ncbi:BnaC04g29860D [Brassica napus]|uniref:BnaC04g29860D protein n=1 Tax=Brassica napus TaxID=3708 RepID=A0A078HK30_BRANA|nr:BnaC04g29860D [Brassica napus]
MGWIWRKRVSLGKKVLAAVLVMFFAPFLVPPLIVASTIALIASLPYCFLLASYVCTEKVMKKLLPATAFGGRGDKMGLPHDKVGHADLYDDGMARVAMSDPCCVKAEEGGTAAICFKEGDNDHITPLRSLLRDDESSANQSLGRGISEKAFGEGEDNKDSTRVVDLSRKKKVYGTRIEGALESTRKEASREKDMEISSNEMKVLYNEEQIWAKMEALRKIVGYSVARSTTYSEELKALYMFMGVELPTLMMLEKENQDIAHVSERLCVLLSVIGIK